MKKKLGVIALTALSIFTLGGVVLSTYSWFVASMKTPEYNLKGKSAGAYFAYGDGKPYEVDNEGKVIHRPFGISIPRHLYNLSWLQYMGQFADDQYYFEIADTVGEEGLDMDGYILPPIGTTDNPFVGNFNGNGKTIKNLTITNNENALFTSSKHPDQTQVSYTEPQIVGLFGVVGEYGDSYTGTYDSQVNSIYNLGLSNLNIISSTNLTLAGIVAGYVNATIEDVAVTDGSIDIQQSSAQPVDSVHMTPNLSDYTIIGFCEDDYKANVKHSTNDIYGIDVQNYHFVANDNEGDSEGWGGSIDMNSLYTRLNGFRDNVTNVNNATYNEDFGITYSHIDDGTADARTLTDVTDTQRVYRHHGYGVIDDPETQTDESDPSYYGNFVYSNIDVGTSYKSKFYLVGGTYQTHDYYTSYQHTGTMIRYGSSDNKLTVNNFTNNGGTIANTTGNSPALWNVPDNSGYIYTTYDYGNDGSIQTYYLNNNNGQLALSTSTTGRTTWYKTTNNNGEICYATQSSKNTANCYYLSFNGTNWVLTQIPPINTVPSSPLPDTPVSDPGTFTETEPQEPTPKPTSIGTQLFYDDNGTYRYLAPSAANANGPFTASTTPLTGGWTKSNNTIYFTSGNTNYYLRPRSGNNNTLNISNSTRNTNYRNWTAINQNNDGTYYFYYTYNRNNYYLRYNNSSFSYGTAGSTANANLHFEEMFTYNGVTYTESAATTAYHNSAAYTQYQQQHDAWQERHDAWQASKDAYDAYVNLVDEWDEYEASVTANTNAINASFCLSQTVITAENAIKGPDYHQTTADSNNSYSRMVFNYDDTTYFPIKVYGKDTYDKNNKLLGHTNEATKENLGYFVGGSTDNEWNGNYAGNSPRNLVFANYEKRYTINGSYTTSNTTTWTGSFDKSKIYTIDGTTARAINMNNQTDADRFRKFNDSVAGLEDVLDGSRTVGGFHFYAANATQGAISTQSIVEARNVRVSGKEYDTYDLPVYSLDFTLKEKGRINFLAGMYNGGYGNNSSGTTGNTHMNGFFSFHKVFRNETTKKIEAIKEIKGVYQDANENYYYSYYANSSYTVNSNGTKSGATIVDENGNAFNASGLTMVFDTDWIGYHKLDGDPGRVYYFEIPADVGEYCFGSYKTYNNYGMDGGYLMYLDIGANARELNRTVFIERFGLTEITQEYPKGVQFAATLTLSNGTLVVDDTNSSCLAILPTYNDKLVISRTNDVITIEEGYDSDLIVGEYKKDEITLINGTDPPGGTIEVAGKTVTAETWRMEYYDYNIATKELTRTVITKSEEIVDGVVQPVVTHIQQYNASGTLIYDNLDEDLDDDTLIKIYNNSGTREADFEAIAIPDDADANTNITIITYNINGASIEIGEIEIVLDTAAIVTTDTTYYKATGYTITITIDSGAATVSETHYNGANAAYSGVTVVVNGYVITITGLNVIAP